MSQESARWRIARQGAHDIHSARMVLGCHSIEIFRWRLRSMRSASAIARGGGRHARPAPSGQRAADAQDLLLKFQRDEIFSASISQTGYGPCWRWFSCSSVSSVCSSTSCSGGEPDVRPAAVAQALCPGRRGAVWVCGVTAQLYVFLIWLEEIAAQKSRSERDSA